MGKLKITVVRALCIAAGQCIEVAPDVFELDGHHKAIVKNPQGADRDTIMEAAMACPTNAIIIVDEETGEQIWPES